MFGRDCFVHLTKRYKKFSEVLIIAMNTLQEGKARETGMKKDVVDLVDW